MNRIDLRSLPAQPPLPFQAAADYADTVLGWAREVPQALILATNVPYGPDPAQRYDVFGTPSPEGSPVLVFWHGGGWTNGYKEYVAFMAGQVARLGMLLVAPGYRLAPAHKLATGFADALAALQHVSRHIPAFGGRADQLYLSGHSAGAHLAALVALRRADAAKAGVDVAHIRACLPISGIMDLHHPAPPEGSLEERIYTMVVDCPAEDATLSPLCWAVGNTVPMWLSHGEFDSDRVVRSNERMAALLALQAGPSRLDREAGLDHFGTHTALRSPDAAWYARLAQLVRQGAGA